MRGGYTKGCSRFLRISELLYSMRSSMSHTPRHDVENDSLAQLDPPLHVLVPKNVCALVKLSCYPIQFDA